ncbi:MAG: PD-(D/E)XK nuclease family protein [Acidimicrobiales bacterium]
MADGAEASIMPVEVVAYGRPATEALARCVAAAKSGHPLDPVTVVVPSNIAGVSARRLLGSGLLGGTGLANVNFVTPLGLAELVGSGRLGARRPLTNPVLAAAVRMALATDAGIFAGVADHRATSAAIVAVYGELSRARPQTLERIAASSPRGEAVVCLVEAVGKLLGDHYDEDDLAAAAADRLSDDPSAGAALGTVAWYLPDRLSPAMTAMVHGALRAATSCAVVVGVTGTPEADAAVRDVCAAAGVAVAATDHVPAPHQVRILRASDPDEEARTVVREVMVLAEAGTALDRIAIFYPRHDPYARTLLEQLDGAGIPHNGPATARLGETAAGRTLAAALALPVAGWSRGDVVGMAAAAPLRHGGRPVAAGRWDDLSRAAGVVGGLDDWRLKVTALAGRVRDETERLSRHGETSAARLRALTGEADAADALASFVDALADGLAAVDGATSWADRSASARALLVQLLGPEHLRNGWPDHEADAAQRVDAALARLAALDEVEPAPSPAAFELAVADELDVRTGRAGRFGHGVLVAPLPSAVGLDLDAVFVVGMAEGTCPTLAPDDALLSDDDRRRAVDGELVTRHDRLCDQHRSFLAALAAGGAHRALIAPRGDLRGRRRRLPSRWLLQAASRSAGRRIFSSDIDSLGPPVIETVASYAGGVATANTHGSLADRDVASLLAHLDAGGDPADHPLADGDLRRGLRCRQARQGAAFTEWDGNLSRHDVPSPATGVPLSASRLERWASCPFRYFLGYVLGLSERDDPELITEIGAADRGSLVHEVLERFIGEAIDRPEGPPAPDQSWSGADRARMRELAGEAFARYEAEGRTGRPLTWRRTMEEVVADLDDFLDHDARHRAASGVRPQRVEMAFGLHGAPPLSLRLPGGRQLSFRGKVDRVDAGDDGRLVVLDYKTGKGGHYDKLDDDPVRAGTTLQLGVYAEAALAALDGTGAESRYWMATSAGQFHQRGYLWDAERRKRFLDVVGTIVDGIETGTFPAQPGAYDSFFACHHNCRYCEFDRVCPRDRDDHQRAKAGAPELALLARLQLPESDEGDEGDQ